MSELSVTISLLSLFYIVFVTINLYIKGKKRKNISWDVKQGIRCYSCKKEIFDKSIDNIDKLDSIFKRIEKDPKSEEFVLCICCNRDSKLEDITCNDFLNKHRINDFKKLLYSKGFDKINIIMLVLMLVFQLIDGLIRHYFKINTMIGSLYTIFYWIIWHYRMCLYYGDKKTLLKRVFLSGQTMFNSTNH